MLDHADHADLSIYISICLARSRSSRGNRSSVLSDLSRGVRYILQGRFLQERERQQYSILSCSMCTFVYTVPPSRIDLCIIYTWYVFSCSLLPGVNTSTTPPLHSPSPPFLRFTRFFSALFSRPGTAFFFSVTTANGT